MQPIPFAAADRNSPVTPDTAAVITYAAVADRRHVISGVAWSYDDDPTGAYLTIEDGAGTYVFELPITAAGPGAVYFDPPRHGTKNTALIITLAAAGGTVSGRLNILGHWKE